MNEYLEVEHGYTKKQKYKKKEPFTVKKCKICKRVYDSAENVEHYYLDWDNTYGIEEDICINCKKPEFKICSKCGKKKPIKEFYKKANNKYLSVCIECKIKQNKEYIRSKNA
jgi:hypothetical protein